ncbi:MULTISPECIES: TetR/AcrR family transcriptional regulator [unclassified Candidatus Frackibacter]|uniref:TetR/AcrR family transcriptional regulator n=1 Tax=unclassified Candidatus Frackibacter TaxID=2648818 RepID=UPI000886A49D|nr:MULTISPECIES: TetR/AcrR family transcriptional regulator [unclassified Candidatus Frackibacter]SDC01547.1 DNA-binding transcriptional regulator, AcrR family [Candidatus Frackibacter sp. WG11]SEM32789.1 DNA-binding transcriptional regulator, AcrR family [Candidatus Frackibacter sp. WG12]SFL37749.1 DNA-binding transcriptional regulator, AcrR family [Candidatus Frackibacter sp. WG13]
MNSKKERIFTAAIDKFSQKGSTNTTMQEIAETAGVGKGTLYRYFENKEDLIYSLIQYGINKMTNQVKEKISQVELPLEKLKIIVGAQLEFYDQHQNFCKFLTREIWGYQSKFEDYIKEIRSNNTVIIENIIKDGIERGVFKELNAETAAVSLSGMINITALHWFMFQDKFPIEKIRNDIIQLYFNGIKKSNI